MRDACLLLLHQQFLLLLSNLFITRLLQALCRDARCVPAGGASEIEMARQVADFGKKQTGLDQYAIAR
jgi:hypothetical protein